MEMSDNNWMSNLVPQGDKDKSDKRLNDNININASQSVQNNINIICINENKDMQTNMNKCAIYIFKPKDQNNKIIYQNKENDKINECKDKENQININKSINNNFSFFEESKRSNLELYEDLNNYSRLINKQKGKNSGSNSSDSYSSKNKNEKLDTYNIKLKEIDTNKDFRGTQIFDLTNEIEKLEEVKSSYESSIYELKNFVGHLESEYNSKKEECNNLRMKLEIKSKEIKNKEESYNNLITNLNCMKQKLSELTKETPKSKVENFSENTNNINEIENSNKKCKHCFMELIKVKIYKCSSCDNYCLCQQCYEKNAETGKHQHFFQSIKCNEENYIINNINHINNNINIIEYSYQCLTQKLRKIIYRGKNELKMQIIIQNNCKYKWPENTKLILDKNNSQLFPEDIKLNPLAPNEQMTLNISFKNLQNLPSNEYKIYFDFNVNGINFGNKLCIIIIIKKDTEKEIINKFRNQYNTPNTYKDETILYILEETDGEFEEAFFRLYLT